MTGIDISGKICDLYPIQGEWPMYSYGRAAWIVWNQIANDLHDAGWSINEIKYWLQSKETRWALDGDLGALLREAAECYAQKMINNQKVMP